MESSNSILNRNIIDKRIYIPYGLEIEVENERFYSQYFDKKIRKR